MNNLTIVSSCCGDYSRYLAEWAESIVALKSKPAAVRLFTHGSEEARTAGRAAALWLSAARVDTMHVHQPELLDLGVARNRAVGMSSTEWVMHLDCDDQIMPHCLDDVAKLAPNADVVSLGYERSGDLASGPTNRTRVYSDSVGVKALDQIAAASGCSPFRRSLWEQKPYRTDMMGAWDTALWIGFARLGARFRATRRPCFWYRQHADSIFNRRRSTYDWTHFDTVARLRALRRGDDGVAVIVPIDANFPADRAAAWAHVRAHYEKHFPWPIIEGVSDANHWQKAQAVADALSRCRASILVIADADCLVQPGAIQAAVDAVVAGAPWAVPHQDVLRMNADRTRRWYAGDESPIGPDDLARRSYVGYAGGGVLVVPRIGYEAAGGIPDGFVGWGGEDQALAIVLDTCLGQHWRGSADLLHLWHEPQASKNKGGGQNSIRFKALAHAALGGRDALLTALGMTGGVQLKPWQRPPTPGAPSLTRAQRQTFLEHRRGAL